MSSKSVLIIFKVGAFLRHSVDAVGYRFLFRQALFRQALFRHAVFRQFLFRHAVIHDGSLFLAKRAIKHNMLIASLHWRR